MPTPAAVCGGGSQPSAGPHVSETPGEAVWWPRWSPALASLPRGPGALCTLMEMFQVSIAGVTSRVCSSSSQVLRLKRGDFILYKPALSRAAPARSWCLSLPASVLHDAPGGGRVVVRMRCQRLPSPQTEKLALAFRGSFEMASLMANWV